MFTVMVVRARLADELLTLGSAICFLRCTLRSVLAAEQSLVDLFRRITLQAGEHEAVRVQSDRDAAVPESFLYHLWMDAREERRRGHGVP